MSDVSSRERVEHQTCDGCGGGIQIYTLSEGSPHDEFLKVEEWTREGGDGLSNLWFCGWDCAVSYTKDNEDDARTDGGHGPHYLRQQAAAHRAMERRQYLLDGRTSAGRRL